MTDKAKDKSRTSRRRRRPKDRASEAPVAEAPKRPVKKQRQLDPAQLQQVAMMVDAFAQQRFRNALPELHKSFFGIASDAEKKNKELQRAYGLWVVYGWTDQFGLRVVDMFRQGGLKLRGEQERVFEALQNLKFKVFRCDEKKEANRYLTGVDVCREDAPMTVLDKALWATLEPGDGAASWYLDVGGLQRPFGIATHLRAANLEGFLQSLDTLTEEDGDRATLADENSLRAFWLAYRAANVEAPAKPPETATE